MAKKDLMKDMPQGVEERKAIQNNINEIVDSLLRIQGEKEQIAAIKEVAESKYGVDGKWVESLAKFRYDELYGESKKIQKAMETSEQLDQYNTYIKK